MSEAFEFILDHHAIEEERVQETDREDGLEEEVSEDEDDTDSNPDQELTDEEESSDEEEGHAEAAVTFKSKNGNLSWSSSPPENQSRPQLKRPSGRSQDLQNMLYPRLNPNDVPSTHL